MSASGTRPLTIFFSVGEPSGDLHAANLMREMRRQRAEVRFVGYGGPQMAAAGCHLHADLTQLAVMWILRVLINLHKFLALAGRADRYFRHHRPDAVVLVDYPGFNWWIARRAKVHGIPVFYYTPPQIWAWASWRVNKMRRFVDHVLCSLPFEESWFRKHGCRATFVGHPFFDEVRSHPLDQEFLARYETDDRPLVAILPGSRTQEVTQNLRAFLSAARRIRRTVPQARFAVACFRPRHAELAQQLLSQMGIEADVFVRKTPELMHLADCCLAVSGSVSLELLYHTVPTVIHYRISPLAYFVQSCFRHVRYITLVNLLDCDDIFSTEFTPFEPAAGATQALFPEYLTSRDRSEELANHAVEWLTQPQRRAERVAALQQLKERVAHGGASRQAATYILQALGARPHRAPRPHFQWRATVSAPAQAA
jgi:lipid-A-disaccharide synthase